MRKRLFLSFLVLLAIAKLAAQQTFFRVFTVMPSTPSCVHETWNGHYFIVTRGYEYFLLDSVGAITWSKKITDPWLSYDGQYGIPTSDHGYALSGIVVDYMTNHHYGYVAKTDSTGQIQWINRTPIANGFSTYTFSGIEQTPDGGFIVAGGYSGTFLSANHRGGLIMKLDAAGNTTWSKVIIPGIAQYSQTELLTVKVAANGDYVAAGVTDSSVVLCRFAPNGNLLWVKTYLANLLNTFTVTLDLTANGDCILCANVDTDNDNLEQVCLLRTDSAGGILWCRYYGDHGQITARCVRATADGGFAFLGLETLTAPKGAAIAKTDGLGNLQWVTKFDSVLLWPSNTWIMVRFEQTSDQGYLFSGIYSGYCVIKTDTAGRTSCKGAPVVVTEGALTTTADPTGYAINAEALTPVSVTEQVNSIADSLLCAGTFNGIAEAQATMNFHLYPNPLRDLLHIESSFPGRLEIYNSTGRLVKKEMISAGAVVLDMRSYPAGLYFAVLDTGTQRITRKFVRE